MDNAVDKTLLSWWATPTLLDRQQIDLLCEVIGNANFCTLVRMEQDSTEEQRICFLSDAVGHNVHQFPHIGS